MTLMEEVIWIAPNQHWKTSSDSLAGRLASQYYTPYLLLGQSLQLVSAGRCISLVRNKMTSHVNNLNIYTKHESWGLDTADLHTRPVDALL